MGWLHFCLCSPVRLDFMAATCIWLVLWTLYSLRQSCFPDSQSLASTVTCGYSTMLVLFADSWRVHSVPLFRSLVKVLNIILIFLMRNTTCNWLPVSEKNNYNSKQWNFIFAEFYIFPPFSKTFMSIVQLSLVSMHFQGFVLAFSLYWIPKRP